MRAIVLAAALMACLSGPSRAYDPADEERQVICDTLIAFEELSIAIAVEDDHAIAEMGDKGCHLPGPCSEWSLLKPTPTRPPCCSESSPTQPQLRGVPEDIEAADEPRQGRLIYGDRDPIVGFTLLPLSHRREGRARHDAAD